MSSDRCTPRTSLLDDMSYRTLTDTARSISQPGLLDIQTCALGCENYEYVHPGRSRALVMEDQPEQPLTSEFVLRSSLEHAERARRVLLAAERQAASQPHRMLVSRRPRGSATFRQVVDSEQADNALNTSENLWDHHPQYLHSGEAADQHQSLKSVLYRPGSASNNPSSKTPHTEAQERAALSDRHAAISDVAAKIADAHIDTCTTLTLEFLRRSDKIQNERGTPEGIEKLPRMLVNLAAGIVELNSALCELKGELCHAENSLGFIMEDLKEDLDQLKASNEKDDDEKL